MTGTIPDEVISKVTIQVEAYREKRLEIEMNKYLRRNGLNPSPPKKASDNFERNAEFYKRYVVDRTPMTKIARDNRLSVTTVRKAIVKEYKKRTTLERLARGYPR